MMNKNCIIHIISINDQVGHERRARLIHQISQQTLLLPFKIVPGVLRWRKASMNIAESHQQIVRAAAQNNLKQVFIMEDDCHLTSTRSLEYFFSQKPANYNLYFGGLYRKERFTDLNTLRDFRGLHCYMVNQNFYKEFLSVPVGRDLDCLLAKRTSLLNVHLCCEPEIAKQTVGYSYHTKREENYDHLIKDKRFLQD